MIYQFIDFKRVRKIFQKRYKFMSEIDEMHYEYQAGFMNHDDVKFYENNYKNKKADGKNISDIDNDDSKLSNHDSSSDDGTRSC